MFYGDGEGFIQTRLKNSRMSQPQEKRMRKPKKTSDEKEEEAGIDDALLEDTDAKEMVSPF